VKIYLRIKAGNVQTMKTSQTNKKFPLPLPTRTLVSCKQDPSKLTGLADGEISGRAKEVACSSVDHTEDNEERWELFSLPGKVFLRCSLSNCCSMTNKLL
jgi:hypothetical protein